MISFILITCLLNVLVLLLLPTWGYYVLCDWLKTVSHKSIERENYDNLSVHKYDVKPFSLGKTLYFPV